VSTCIELPLSHNAQGVQLFLQSALQASTAAGFFSASAATVHIFSHAAQSFFAVDAAVAPADFACAAMLGHPAATTTKAIAKATISARI
jgi:hypothetical protein